MELSRVNTFHMAGNIRFEDSEVALFRRRMPFSKLVTPRHERASTVAVLDHSSFIQEDTSFLKRLISCIVMLGHDSTFQVLVSYNVDRNIIHMGPIFLPLMTLVSIMRGPFGILCRNFDAKYMYPLDARLQVCKVQL